MSEEKSQVEYHVGRPTKYKPEYCAFLIEHMKKGLSFEAFGGVVEVSKQTLYDWCEAYAEFQEAKDIGYTASMLWWEKLGKSRVVNKSDSSNGVTRSRSLNAAVYNLQVKNRFGLRERQPGDVDSSITNTNSNGVLSIDQVTEKIHQMMPSMVKAEKPESET